MLLEQYQVIIMQIKTNKEHWNPSKTTVYERGKEREKATTPLFFTEFYASCPQVEESIKGLRSSQDFHAEEAGLRRIQGI